MSNELKLNVLHEYYCTCIPINPITGYQLLFDNEVPELKLIIEVHGIQHYEVTGWHITQAKKSGKTPEEEFEYQKWKDEFKMNYDESGNLGVYDIVHPRYPIFHESDERISILWTEYSEDFKVFYSSFISDIEKYGEKRSMAAKGKFPPNCFDMSSLPWSSFTSFDCPPTHDVVWLPPFVMVGRFFESNDKMLLPVSISVHHATCDGYHVSRFFSEFQNLAKDFEKYL